MNIEPRLYISRPQPGQNVYDYNLDGTGYKTEPATAAAIWVCLAEMTGPLENKKIYTFCDACLMQMSEALA